MHGSGAHQSSYNWKLGAIQKQRPFLSPRTSHRCVSRLSLAAGCTRRRGGAEETGLRCGARGAQPSVPGRDHGVFQTFLECRSVCGRVESMGPMSSQRRGLLTVRVMEVCGAWFARGRAPGRPVAAMVMAGILSFVALMRPAAVHGQESTSVPLGTCDQVRRQIGRAHV